MRRRSQGRRRSVDRGTHGQGIEPRNHAVQGADAVSRSGRQHGRRRYREPPDGPARSQTPRTCEVFLRENREIHELPAADGAAGRIGKAEGRTPMMHDSRKSDRPVVLTKPSNKAEPSVAEGVEGRGLAKGNTDEQNASRTQRRKRCAQCARPCTPESKTGQEVLHPWPDERFDVRTRGRSPVQ
jgi:hypothetical protein